MNDLSEVVEQLVKEMDALKLRVSALESPGRLLPLRPGQPQPLAPALAAPVSATPESGVFPVLGKAMLAVAGAYLLRALAASAALPRLPVIAIAIAYAFLWLVPAGRARTWFVSVAWASTSALILIPMLWELTLRFHTLPSAVTAAILAGFVVAASALAWNHRFAEVSWVADAAASLAALTFAIAIRDLAPFISALLFIVIVGEIAAACRRTLRVRPLLALTADAAIFALLWIYSSPSSLRAAYPDLAEPVLLLFAPALLLIDAASAAVQTMLLRRGISWFETAQVLVAALLSVWTALAFWPEHGPLVLGMLCLMASAAGYALVFAWFDRVRAQRNYHVYATGSLALLMAGSFLCLTPGWLPVFLSLSAVAAVVIGLRAPRFTLQGHALALLAAAAFSAGLLQYTFRSMVGAFSGEPGPIVALTGACTIVCYAAAACLCEEPSSARILRLLFAALAVGSTTALLVWTLARLVAVVNASGAEHLAVIRTLAGCVVAFALAWCGSRWVRRELVWLAWATLAFIAFKLLFEDLRHGHLGFTAASIFLYAVTLLLVPRLLHIRSKPTGHRSD